jgi:hypothetical protein
LRGLVHGDSTGFAVYPQSSPLAVDPVTGLPAAAAIIKSRDIHVGAGTGGTRIGTLVTVRRSGAEKKAKGYDWYKKNTA